MNQGSVRFSSVRSCLVEFDFSLDGRFIFSNKVNWFHNYLIGFDGSVKDWIVGSFQSNRYYWSFCESTNQ